MSISQISLIKYIKNAKAPHDLSKIQKITSVGEDVGKLECLWTVDGSVDGRFSHYEKQYRESSKKVKIEIPYDPAVSLPTQKN